MYTTCDAELKEFEKKLGYEFKDIGLLKKALIHTSYLNEKMEEGLKESNERMEFLGDSILSAVITHLLTTRYPEMDEGGLSKLRARIVSEPTLSHAAMGLSVGQYIFLGKGEELTGGREKPSMLADAFEAIIGAMYLDKGFDKTFDTVKGYFDTLLSKFSNNIISLDYKTDLQEYVQGRFKTVPQYRLIDKVGPEHDKTFIVNVVISGEMMGTGRGKSKKEAEQQAAREALIKLKYQD
ncbi:MAG: ribonuclease III [Deltaproteobacteria bacterium]|nr:ribonuclease III [Deltaproteobacteria bacterium]